MTKYYDLTSRKSNDFYKSNPTRAGEALHERPVAKMKNDTYITNHSYFTDLFLAGRPSYVRKEVVLIEEKNHVLQNESLVLQLAVVCACLFVNSKNKAKIPAMELIPATYQNRIP